VTPGEGTVVFVWDGDVVLHELRMENSENKESERQLETIHWEFDPHGYAPIRKVDCGGQYLCVNDASGIQRELVTEGGDVVWSAQLSSWGEVLERRTSQVDCPVRLQGQWHDEETGLHCNRWRYYDPSSGGFISPDVHAVDRTGSAVIVT